VATVVADGGVATGGCSAWLNCGMPEWRSAATGASAFRIAWSTASGTLGRTARTLGGGSLNRFARIA
jgi:hypothetical protein